MKIHSSQNLSHTNDKILRTKSFLYMIKSTEIDIAFEAPSKKIDISIFLQGFWPTSLRHDWSKLWALLSKIAQENFEIVNNRFSSYFQNVNDQRFRRLGPQIFVKLQY